MSAIRQKKSVAFNQSTTLTLDNPVVKGNLLIVGGAAHTAHPNLVITDSDGGSYTLAVEEITFGSVPIGTAVIYYVLAIANGNLSVSLETDSNNSHLHVYEIQGYNVLDQTGFSAASNFGTNSSVSTSGVTNFAAEFVLAMWFGQEDFGPWTPQAGADGMDTGDGSTSAFSEGFEVTQAGVVTATATNPDFGNEIPGVIVTFYSNLPADPPFLGTVRVVDSAPAGVRNPFIGKIIVLAEVPGFAATNPYLGSVVLGSAPAGEPVIGNVVVVSDVPAGQRDVFLGTTSES